MSDIGLEVHNEIKKFSNMISRYTRKNTLNIGDDKITRSQASILKFIIAQLQTNAHVYQKDVEEHFSIRRSTATESLKKLEALGLITRIVSKQDARLKEINLTQKAKYLDEQAESNIHDLCVIIGKGLTHEELTTIKQVVIKMQNNLKEYNISNGKNS